MAVAHLASSGRSTMCCREAAQALRDPDHSRIG
jgi:hypothetical protein